MTTKQIQCLLLFLGYDVGEADGICGPRTNQGIQEFQRENMVNGEDESDTWQALRKAVGDGWRRPEKQGTLWENSPYFRREEFRCRCGNYHAAYCNGFPVEPDETLVVLANRVREQLGRKAHVTSGIRCKRHNADQPGAAVNSRHLSGKALDFWVEGISGTRLLETVKRQPEVNYAYIVSGNVVHMDVK